MAELDKIKIQKIKVGGKAIYPATIIDAVKDASKTITVNGQEVDNPSFGKTLREIIVENEKVTAAALNEQNERLIALEGADASAVTAEKIEAWNQAVEDIATLKGDATEDGSIAKAIKEAKDEITGTADDAATALTLNGLSKAVAAEEAARKAQIGDLGKVGEGEDAVDQTVKGYVDAAVEAASDGASAEVDALNETLFGKEAVGEEGEEGYVPAVEGEIPALKARVSANETAIATLTGEGEGSVKKAAADATAAAVAQLINDSEDDPIDEKFDTLKEIADWVLSSEENAEGLNAAERLDNIETVVGKAAKEEVSHEATEEDVEAGKATEVGQKVVDSEAVEASGLVADVAAAQKAADDETARATAAEKAIAEFDADGELVGGALKDIVDNGFSAEDTTDTTEYADVF